MIHYDYIVKLETFSEDVHHIFSQIGKEKMTTEVQENMKKPSKDIVKNSRQLRKMHEEKLYYEYFNDVPAALLVKLVDFMRDDLTLFGYDLPHFMVQKIKDFKKG